MKKNEADVMIISVRHVPFLDADEVLSRWNPMKQGYVFHIFSENICAQDYLQKKYLQEERNE